MVLNKILFKEDNRENGIQQTIVQRDLKTNRSTEQMTVQEG